MLTVSAKPFPLKELDIADCADGDIRALDDAELVTFIRRGHASLLKDVEPRLEFQDRETLLRLAFLTRQCCRNC